MAEIFDSLAFWTHFTPEYLIAFCSQLEVMSDVMSGRFFGPVVPDNRVKFSDPCLNRSREIPPEAV